MTDDSKEKRELIFDWHVKVYKNNKELTNAYGEDGFWECEIERLDFRGDTQKFHFLCGDKEKLKQMLLHLTDTYFDKGKEY